MLPYPTVPYDNLSIALRASTAGGSECKALTNDTSRCWLFPDNDTRTWADAAQTCIGLDGHLLVFNDTELQDELKQEAENSLSVGSWWIGLKNTLLTLQWQTHLGQAFGTLLLA